MYVASKHVAYTPYASAVSGQSGWLANLYLNESSNSVCCRFKMGGFLCWTNQNNRVAQGKVSSFSPCSVCCPPPRLDSARSGGRGVWMLTIIYFILVSVIVSRFIFFFSPIDLTGADVENRREVL